MTGVYDHSGRRNHYVVYLNKTDTPVIIDGTSTEAAAAMGLTSMNSFYSILSKTRKGEQTKWYIETLKPGDPRLEADDE